VQFYPPILIEFEFCPPILKLGILPPLFWLIMDFASPNLKLGILPPMFYVFQDFAPSPLFYPHK